MSGYTKIPNEAFELMDKLKPAEFKLLMLLYRETLGYRRDRVRASYTKLSEATGLSRPYVMRCGKRLEELGLFARNDDGNVTEWVVNSVNLTGKQSLPFLPNWLTKLTGTGKQSLPPSIKGKEKEKNTPPISPPADHPSWKMPASLDTAEFEDAWILWYRHRADKGAPLTQTSGEVQLEQLAELGEERAIAAIKHSVGKGWKNIYEPGDFVNGNGKNEYGEAIDDEIGGFNL